MCGVAVVCTSESSFSSSSVESLCADVGIQTTASPELLAGLRARGPDFLGSETVMIPGAACCLTFIASLLQLRGTQPGVSPCLSKQGHILCFNGEIFGGLQVALGENDGACLLDALARVQVEGADCSPSVQELISRLRGPWALLFWDPLEQRLWFGRDVLGRRSLLIHFPDAADPRLLLSSVSELPVLSTPCSQGAPTPSSSAGQKVFSSLAVSNIAASDGRRGRGGGDAGADGDELEPLGSDGFWTELPPGLYSISFTSIAQRRAEEQLQTTRAYAAGGAAGPREGRGGSLAPDYDRACATVPVPYRCTAVGDFELLVEQHAWRDSMLLQLESYCRTESAVGTAAAAAGLADRVSGAANPEGGDNAVEGVSEDLSVRCDGHDASAVADAAVICYDLPQCPVPSARYNGTSEAVAAEGTGQLSRPQAMLLAHPGRCPRAGNPVEELAGALLCALTAAMRLRCGCIETRSQHPAAAYAKRAVALTSSPAVAATAGPAAAAAVGLSSAVQPSWRREDPLDFSLCGVTTTTISTTASATTAEGPSHQSSPQPPLVASAGYIHNGSQCSDGDRVPWVSATPGIGATVSAAPYDCPARSMGQWDAAPGKDPALLLHAPVMILFSGGVDSVLLAALAHRVLPLQVPIDLSNVCFAGSSSRHDVSGGGASPSPDRMAARDALEELAAACPGRSWRLIEVDAALADVDRHRQRLLALLRPALTVMDLNIGAALWLAASGQGTLRLPTTATGTQSTSVTAGTSVSAPQQLAVEPSAPSRAPAEVAPITGAPFAAGAGANTHAFLPGQFYGSAGRVVLLGHGADEQCGGYGRHRTHFRNGGWSGLSKEMEVDVRRLWLRNLGRDDRLVADWGREGRHPFLDEQVMRLLLHARLEHICDLRQPSGLGDKVVLRTALKLLGLPRAAARVKRAIQFGSRIGKLSNCRDFGSNRAANRLNVGCVALQDIGATERSGGVTATSAAALAGTTTGPAA